MAQHKLFTVLFILFFFPVALLADTVILRNGQRVTGKIVNQTRTTVVVRQANGRTRTIQKSNIRRITFGDAPAPDRAKQEEARRKREEEARQKKEEEERLKREEEQRKAEEEAAQREAAEEAARKAAEERERAERTTFGAFWRSALLPGWGQVYQGRNIGWFYGGAFVATGAGILRYDQIYRSNRSAYEETANLFFLTSPAVFSAAGFSISSTLQFYPLGFTLADATTRARVRAENAARWSNYLRSLLIGVYVWNLADVIIFAPSDEEKISIGPVGYDSFGMKFSANF
mgnify:CR=1 FL=1